MVVVAVVVVVVWVLTGVDTVDVMVAVIVGAAAQQHQ